MTDPLTVWPAWPEVPPDVREVAPDFVGRQWLFDALGHWYRSDDPLFLVVGSPGSGKTAVAAQLVRASRGELPASAVTGVPPGGIDVVHFCRAQYDTLDPLPFVLGLSGQLATRHPEFLAALEEVNRKDIAVVQRDYHVQISVNRVLGGSVTGVAFSLDAGDPLLTYNRLVARPLSMLQARGAPLRAVVLLDGLDEALLHRGEDNLVGLLTAALTQRDRPAGLRYVVTSGPRQRDVIAKLPAAPHDLQGPEGGEDVVRYARARLAAVVPEQDRRERLARRIAEAGECNLLYARYVLDGLTQRLAAVDEPDPEAVQLPAGLDEHYRAFVDELARDESRWRRQFGPVLAVVTVSRADGLRRGQLCGVAPGGLPESEVDEALDCSSGYLRAPTPDGPFRLFHRSFRQFLLSQNDHPLYPGEADAAVATYLLDSHQPGWPARTEEDRYAVSYTASHLLSAISETAAPSSRRTLTSTLERLLRDLSYLEARVGGQGVDSLLADVRQAMGSSPDGSDDVRSLHEVLQQEVRNLARWDRDKAGAYLAQQIHNRAVICGADAVREDARDRLAELGKPYLALRWRQELPEVRPPDTPGHTDRIWSLDTTSDGRSAVTGSQDTTIRVWDLQTGDEVHVMAGHGDTVSALAIVPGGRQLVSGSWDGSVRLWDLVSGEPLALMSGHEDGVNCVRVTADGRYALSGSDDYTVRVWDLSRGAEVATLTGHRSDVGQLELSPDGRYAVSAAIRDGDLRVWDLQRRSLHRTLAGHELGVTAVAGLPDGRRVVSGGRDGRVVVWDLETGGALRRLDRQADEVWWLAARGRYAVAASRDGTMTRWDVAADFAASRLPGHALEVQALALSPDGRLAASASWDRTITLWDLPNGEQRASLRGHVDGITGLRFATSGRLVSASWDCDLRLWDVPTGTQLRRFRGWDHGVKALALSTDRSTAASADGAGRLAVWDTGATGDTSRRAVTEAPTRVSALAFSPDGSQLAAGDENGGVTVHGSRGLDLLRSLASGHDARVLALVMPDADTIVGGLGDGTVVTWRAPAWQPEERRGLSRWVDAVALAAGRLQVFAPHDRSLVVLPDTADAEAVVLGGHRHWVRSLAVTPDGRVAATGAGDRVVRRWALPGVDEEAGAPGAARQGARREPQIDDAVGRRPPPQPPVELRAHSDEVWAVALSADGNWVASAGWDRALALWAKDATEPIALGRLDGALTALALAADGSLAVAGDAAGQVWCFDVVVP